MSKPPNKITQSKKRPTVRKQHYYKSPKKQTTAHHHVGGAADLDSFGESLRLEQIIRPQRRFIVQNCFKNCVKGGAGDPFLPPIDFWVFRRNTLPRRRLGYRVRTVCIDRGLSLCFRVFTVVVVFADWKPEPVPLVQWWSHFFWVLNKSKGWLWGKDMSVWPIPDLIDFWQRVVYM